MHGLKTTGEKIFDWINALLMIFLIVIFAYPMWDTLMLSLSNPVDAGKMGFRWLPSWPLDFSAYKTVFQNPVVLTAYKNSIIRTVMGTITHTFVTFIAGYSLSKSGMPGRNVITFFFLITMFFSPGLIPSYLWIKQLNLFNTFAIYFVTGFVSVGSIFVCRNFMLNHPAAILEAAEIDGANAFQTMFRVVIPMSKPIIAVNALGNALMHWNSWYDAYLYNTDPDLIVLPLLLRRLLIDNEQTLDLDAALRDTALMSTPESVKAATIIVTIGPILMVYPWLQKYFVKGVYLGAVKG